MTRAGRTPSGLARVIPAPAGIQKQLQWQLQLELQ
jgi:hypothetical protein